MNPQETKEFFECLGEIWRDIVLIEFLMRCAIAKKDGDIIKIPKPPYSKGKVYKDYPDSFWHWNLEIIVEKFNKHYPTLSMPKELTELRHAMAHGLIAQVNNSEYNQLIKFKESKEPKELRIEFSMTLEPQRLTEIRKNLSLLRQQIQKLVDEK
jgi:hypothetical protein